MSTSCPATTWGPGSCARGAARIRTGGGGFAVLCLTTWLRRRAAAPPRRARRAGNRARTGDLNLGKVALYQLSYARVLRAPNVSRPRHRVNPPCPGKPVDERAMSATAHALT